MFLNLSHTKLDVYHSPRAFVRECYRITKEFPADERFSMVQQIRRAALSVHLNLAEGCSRKSTVERSRYFEISRGSVTEIDACLDVAADLKYVHRDDLLPLGKSMVTTFKLLSGMIIT